MSSSASSHYSRQHLNDLFLVILIWAAVVECVLMAQGQQVSPAVCLNRCKPPCRCIIHHQALVTKKIPKEPCAVVDEEVNLNESCAMNVHLFFILCIEMGTHFQQLLLHTEVRSCDLCKEVLLFLSQINSPLVQHMEDMN